MERDFERWPRYKELYIRAFDKMLKTHPATEEALKNLNKPPVGGGGVAVSIRREEPRIMDAKSRMKTPEEVMHKWIETSTNPARFYQNEQ